MKKAILLILILLIPLTLAQTDTLDCNSPTYVINENLISKSCENNIKESHHHFFDEILDQIDLKNISVILLLALSFVFGMLHAITPGHGKSIIISYLLGKNAKVKDLILLSLTTAATHMSDIFIVSILFLFFLPFNLKHSLSHHISTGAAILILIFGIYLFIKNLKPHHHQHTNKKEFLFAGFLTGLAPCPSAWAFFLVFIGLGLYFKAFLSVIAFTIGTISTIFFVGMIFLKAKSLIKFIPKGNNLTKFLPLLSSLIIISIGLFLIYRNFFI